MGSLRDLPMPAVVLSTLLLTWVMLTLYKRSVPYQMTQQYSRNDAVDCDLLDYWDVGVVDCYSKSDDKEDEILIAMASSTTTASDIAKSISKTVEGTTTTTTTHTNRNKKLLKDDPFSPTLFEITEGQHVSPPPPAGPCSCWNTTTECCQRAVHPNHKFGHELVASLFADGGPYHFQGMPTGRLNSGYVKPPEYFHRADYREVHVTRDWFDAIVSGYLYHKSGKECSIDVYGNPIEPGKHWGLVDPDFIELVKLPTSPFPPANGRDLCTYLSEESEYDGMRVYSEWIIRRFYFKTVTIFRLVQSNEEPIHRRTLFVCFEDLNNPITKVETANEIVNWLYPGGQHAAELPTIPSKEVAVEYNGGHSTSRDPNLRKRLHDLVEQLDKEVFNDTIRHYSSFFKCKRE